MALPFYKAAVRTTQADLEVDAPTKTPSGFAIRGRVMGEAADEDGDVESGSRVPVASYHASVSRIRHDGADTYVELTATLNGIEVLTAPWEVTSLASRREVLASLGTSQNTGTWQPMLNALAAKVVQARRLESRIVRLRDVEPSEEEAWFMGGPLPLLRQYPNIWFGQGGTCKSLLALRAAGELAKQGVKVLYLDWELDEQAHHDRLQRMYPSEEMPGVLYWHADMPLAQMVVDLKDVIQKEGIEFVVCDSIGFATEGAAETSAAARTYGNALRALGVGSLNLAHVTKPKGRAEEGSRFPFGSIFWHNVARCTWNLMEDPATTKDCTRVVAKQRKWSMDAQRPDHLLAVQFEDDGDGRGIVVTSRTEDGGGGGGDEEGEAPPPAKALTLMQRITKAIQDGCTTSEEVQKWLDDGDTNLKSVAAKLRTAITDGVVVKGEDGELSVAVTRG